jgi:hypothetical protein
MPVKTDRVNYLHKARYYLLLFRLETIVNERLYTYLSVSTYRNLKNQEKSS